MKPISKESLVVGENLSSISSTATTWTVRFDRKLPNKDIIESGIELDIYTELFVIDRENESYEFAYIPASCRSYDSDTGITTIDLSTVGKRGLAYAGAEYTTEVTANKKSHTVGSTIEVATDHYSDAITADILNGLTAFTPKIEGTPTWDTSTANTALTKPVYADVATGESVITSPVNGMEFYATSEGVTRKYEGGAWGNSTGIVTPNASTTVAGKVEQATATETDQGGETGGTGAKLFATPKDIAGAVQDSAWIYGSSVVGTDSYAFNLTPALTAYATGQKFRLKADVANTGACTLNINSLGAKAIKKYVGGSQTDPEDGDIASGMIIDLIYDGTSMVMINPPATGISSADKETLTDGSDANSLHTHTLSDVYGAAIFLAPFTAGDDYIAEANTERSGNDTSYTKIKEIVADSSGTFRIVFSMNGDGASGTQGTYGRIYKNGVAFGTERFKQTASYATYSEDLAFTAGDLIQIYAYVVDSSAQYYIKDFKVGTNYKGGFTVNTD